MNGRVEDFLKQLDAFVAGMGEEDRDRAGKALSYVIYVLRKYPNTIKAGAFLKFISSLGIAHGMETTDKFWIKVKDRAAKIGPHVDAIFQAL